MNKTICHGIITRNAQIRQFETNGTPLKSASFTLAVNSGRRKKDGEGFETDFIPCMYVVNASSKVTDYLNKGTSVMTDGYIRSRSYEKDGNKIYLTENCIRSLELMGSGSGVNVAVVSGNLTRDAEIRQSGEYVIVNFAVASNQRRNGADYVEYINVSYIRKNVGKLIDYLKKGASVVVSGSIHAGSYKKDENWKSFFSVSAQSIHLSGKKDSANSVSDGEFVEIDDDDGEVPF